MRFRGDVLKAGQPYLSGVTGEVNQRDTGGGITTWEGWFDSGSGQPEPGDDYRLVLNDGRVADISVFSTQSASGRRARTYFSVNGAWG